MRELDFEPEMVGREKELNELQAYLDNAVKGRGNTVFISGEAGIGKTRLLNELKQIAQSKDFQVLSGYSLHETLTPYMPFIEALRSGGMENLFAEEAPRVETVYLVTHSGLLVKEVIREDTKLNPDLFTSMLVTVGNFVKDSLSMLSGKEKEGALNTLGYENYRILIESGRDANLVVILTGRENEFLIDEMRDIFLKIYKRYESVLRDWDGEEESIYGIEKLIEPLITSGKYDGIYYGKVDPKARRNLLFENVSLGLMRQSQKAPTLLCIEDLQWGDPSSLALIHYVARNTAKSELLVLGTYRPEDVAFANGKGHPLTETMQLMDREGLCNELKLQRLPEESVSKFLSSLLGKVDFSDKFKNRVYKETEGNPLFVIELVKLMVDEQIIRLDNGTWKLAKDLEEVDIPSRIYNVIVRRLNRVEKEERKILDYASLIGESFTSTILSDALDLKKIQLLERLKVLEKVHRLIHSFNGNFKFDHAKIKEVLYDEIPQELRMEYHAVIADSIEQFNKGNLNEVIGDLAFHYYHCRNSEKALFYLKKAADKAKKDYSNEEAIRFYRQALELEEDKQKRMEILEGLGEVYNWIGKFEKSEESYKSALELTEFEKKMAEIKANIGGIYMKKGEHDEAIRICTDAIHLVKGEECNERALTLNNIAAAYMKKAEYKISLEHYKRSLEIRERIGDQMGVAHILNNVGALHMYMGDYDKSLESFERSLKIEEKIDDQYGIAHSLNNIGALHCDKGEYNRAIENWQRSLEIREKIGDQKGIPVSLNNIGLVHYFIGENHKALEYYKKSLEIAEKIGDQWGIAASINHIGDLYCDKGEFDSAIEYFKKSLKIGENIGDQHGMAASLRSIGKVYLEGGEYDKSLEHFERGLDIQEKIGQRREYSQIYSGMAEAHFRKGDLKRALEFCNRAFELSKELDQKDEIAHTKRVLGMIYRDQKNWEKSINNFDSSIKIFMELKREKDLGNSYYEFGLMWKTKGDDGKAKEHLDKALQIFEKLDLKNNVGKAKSALKTL